MREKAPQDRKGRQGRNRHKAGRKPDAGPDTPRAESVNPRAASGELRPPSRAPFRNFVTLALHQIVTRTGWIFKTESIVMPAVLDTVAGAGWVRGWLPLLNRFGHSVPPLLMARRVKITKQKKWMLFVTTVLMSVLFLLLAGLFTGPAERGSGWVPIAFLAIYTVFFMCIGVKQLAFNTLQGKLVSTTSRGRLLLVSNTIGAATAVVCVFLLMPGWLAEDAPRFDLIFGFSGLMFGVAALTALWLVEAPDQHREPVLSIRRQFTEAWLVWRRDANFRRLTSVSALFSVSIMLFPHYQNLGLQGMQLELKNLMWWVMIQNIGTGVFSIPAGRLADRKGNRAVLLITMLGIAAAPLVAITLHRVPGWGSQIYPLVFVFVGLTPVVLRTLQNFTLEICPAEDHPRYLSTLALCSSAPMFLSPLVGLCIDLLGFATVFIAVAGLNLCGWYLAFGLQEPREHVTVGYLETGE